MSDTPAARRRLVLAMAVLLFGGAVGAQAQGSSEWLEVCTVAVSGNGDCSQPASSVSVRVNESGRYYIRLRKVPIKLDRQTGEPVLDGQGMEQPVGSGDPWWVRVTMDGSTRPDGYDVDGNDQTGDAGNDLTMVPSIGRPFHKDNYNQWVDIRITAHSDIRPVPVVFSHEVWSNDTYCPEHGVVPCDRVEQRPERPGGARVASYADDRRGQQRPLPGGAPQRAEPRPCGSGFRGSRGTSPLTSAA